jgi:hypothetical protein
LGVNLEMHQAWDRDCRSATGHDFQMAKAERERQVALERQDGLKQHLAQPQRALERMAALMEQEVLLRQAARTAEPRAPLAELVLAQGHWGQTRQASLQPAQLEPERAPSVQPALERQPQALLAPLASRSVSPAQAVLRELARRWLAVAGQVRRQASFARLVPQHPSRPSPLWLWLRQPLQPLLAPGCFCGPFQPRPPGSS